MYVSYLPDLPICARLAVASIVAVPVLTVCVCVWWYEFRQKG